MSGHGHNTAKPAAPSAFGTERMYVIDPETIDRIACEVLHSEAWWTAARTGLYAESRLIWADRQAGSLAAGTDEAGQSAGEAIEGPGAPAVED